MQEIEFFVRANRLFTSLVDQVPETGWDDPTPDEGWTVRDLVNHVAHNNDLVTSALEEIEGDTPDDLLGDTPKENYRLLAEQADDAASQLSDGSEMVAGPMGDMSARDLLRLMTCDRTIHAWDLGAALDAVPDFDDDILEAVDEWFQPPAEMRADGTIGDEIEVADDADTLTRILARSGRQAV